MATADEIRNMQTKKAKLEAMRENIAKAPTWGLAALLGVWFRQTDTEKSMRDTKDLNGVGFTGVDAPFMSALAEQFVQRGCLSTKQMVIVHKRMIKYAAQLLDIFEHSTEATKVRMTIEEARSKGGGYVNAR